MNKFSKLLCGVAAMGMMFSCSSDEPAVNPENPTGDGVAYLAIDIKDANTMGRALAKDINDAAEGDYMYGTGNESVVSNAKFYFFDANGYFVTEATVWTGGAAGTTENIEYIGDNVLVLRNLKKGQFPKYMLTVLNAPANFTPAPTLEGTATKTLESVLNGNNFIMTTTTFIADDNTEGNYDSKYPYANVLVDGDFSEEPILNANQAGVTPVKVYVERMASKLTMSGLTPTGVYEVEVTVAGNINDNIGGEDPGTGVGATKLYIKFDGWAANNVEKSSYVSKQIAGFTANPIGSFVWNDPNYHRSYWGESVSYGMAEPNLNYTTWATAKKTAITKPLYTHETTNTAENISNEGNLLNSKVASVIFAATVYADDKCTTAPDLVLYNGVYFTKDQYFKYALNILQAGGGLNFYVKTSSLTQEVEGYTPTVIDEYTQITPEFIKLEKKGNATGVVQLTSNVPAGTELWTKDADNNFTKVGTSELNTLLADFNNSVKATAYTGGKMFYSVPVEHLASITSGKIVEGNYGLVRNHWYDIKVNKVIRMGQGVFNPGDGTSTTPGEPLIPDDEDPKAFGLGAQVNILSWKIVKQTVDL